MRLRNYVIGLIPFLFFLLVAWAMANAYTTDSEISPAELFKWEEVQKTGMDRQGFYYIVKENPELRLDSLDCPIKYVLLCIDNRKKKLVAYAYYRDDELMIFEIIWKDRTHQDGHFQRIYRIVLEARRIIDFFLQPLLKKITIKGT